MAALETVDIPGVEVLATGGPVKAIGSPPEGDFYSRADLERMAEAMVELGDEIKAPLKIGHSDRQQLLKNSGLTAGEMPAIGWLDSRSFRVEDDPETGGAKLVADAKAVPKTVDAIIKSGAYRTRSSEIKRYASQITQKTYDWVVSGLALMGGQIPAIQTLDDVYRLYEQQGFDEPDRTITYVVRHAAADGTVVWDPTASMNGIREDLEEALNGPVQSTMGPPRYWVSDVTADGKALICGGGYDSDEWWVVTWTRAGDGTMTVAPSSDWQQAEQTWIATARENQARLLAAWDAAYINSLPDSAFLHVESGGTKDKDGKTVPRSNRHLPVRDENGALDVPHIRGALSRLGQPATGKTGGGDSWLTDNLRATLTTKATKLLDQANRKNRRAAESRPMELTLTEEQVAEVRETLGLEADAEVTADAIVEAGKQRANELAEAKTKLEERKNEHDDETVVELQKRLDVTERKLFEADRDAVISDAVREGKITPADKEAWEKRFERDPDLTKEVIADLRVDEDLVREFGREERPDEEVQAAEDAYKADAARRFGVPVEEIA